MWPTFFPCLMYYLHLWMYTMENVNVHTQIHCVLFVLEDKALSDPLKKRKDFKCFIYHLCTQVDRCQSVPSRQCLSICGHLRLMDKVVGFNLSAVFYVQTNTNLRTNFLQLQVWKCILETEFDYNPLQIHKRKTAWAWFAYTSLNVKKHFGLNTPETPTTVF